MRWSVVFAVPLALGCAHALKAPELSTPAVWIRGGPQFEVALVENEFDAKAVPLTPVVDEDSSAQPADKILVYSSDKLDPCRALGNCGFWIALTEGGKTERLYTGVTRFRPYVLFNGAGYPRREGNDLFVLAQQADLHASSLLVERNPQLLMLRFDLRVLRQDSDQDGLTDLEEERLLTSPSNPDTDGDGRGDAEDINPLVKLASAATSRADLLRQAVLMQHLSKVDHLVLLRSDTRFDLPDAPFRLLTLNATQLEHYQADFGVRDVEEVIIGGCGDHPCDASHPNLRWPVARHAFNETDRHAIAQFDTGSSSTVYRATWDGDHWKLEQAGYAIAQR